MYKQQYTCEYLLEERRCPASSAPVVDGVVVGVVGVAVVGVAVVGAAVVWEAGWRVWVEVSVVVEVGVVLVAVHVCKTQQ